MKDQRYRYACANGDDCTSPPIRQNAQGEYRQRGQQADFDQCFHHRIMRLTSPVFQSYARAATPRARTAPTLMGGASEPSRSADRSYGGLENGRRQNASEQQDCTATFDLDQGWGFTRR